jgi:miniconductance mechanosensitive channel
MGYIMLKTMIENFLVSLGTARHLADDLAVVVFMALIVVGAYVLYWLLRNYLLTLIQRVTAKTSNSWDDALMRARVFHRFLRLIPLTFVAVCIDRSMPDTFVLLKRILFALIILSGARAIEAFLNAVSEIYHQRKTESRKPIRPFIQTLIIVDYLFAAIFIIGVLLNKSPWNLFGLLGGLTAVTMLVFKDTILGFVAGIQLGANDMVREGDWIEMPKYGADGDVIEVAVNTVKVRNWDKTISTIPTYALISDSFKNWRGMSESEGRRIKRSICIDMNTVRFVDESLLEEFRKMDLLKDYVEQRQQEIDGDNRERGLDLSASVVNGRRQTNLGLFRAYLLEYLRQHPGIHQTMTFLVRHLQPTPQGLPIEIYVFSNDKVWANYEAIQSDIFDHILASVSAFGLQVYQQPSGSDFSALVRGDSYE